jgi:predicted O-methyltransferase YrrM
MYRAPSHEEPAPVSARREPFDRIEAPLSGSRSRRPPMLLTPAARKSLRQRMLRLRTASLERVGRLAGCDAAEIKAYRHELMESELPDLLIARGASLPFAHEFPHGGLLYLLVRALRPRRVVETGVRPGYSTTWILGALEANRAGQLTSLGPGPVAGRAPGVDEVTVGQFVPPSLRARWTLRLGNTPDRLAAILDGGDPVDLFFYDNGPDAERARHELRSAWGKLAPNGVVLAHHVDANPVWAEFCRGQGMSSQVLDAGPPPLGALGVRSGPIQ